MRIEYLEEFLELARTLSFTQTAKHFYLTQSVLSKHIAHLETELGVTLFLRTRNKVALTDVGEHFLEDARRVVKDYRRLDENLKRYLVGKNAHLSVAYDYLIDTAQLAEGQKRFGDRYPDVSVNYRRIEYFQMFNTIDNETADVVVAAFGRHDEERYAVRELAVDHFAAVVAPGHPLSELESIVVEDLIPYKVVLPTNEFAPSVDRRTLAYLNPAETGIVFEKKLNDTDSLPIELSTNPSVAIVPGMLSHYYSDELAFLPIRDMDLIIPIRIVWARSKETDMIFEYIDVINEVFDEIES